MKRFLLYFVTYILITVAVAFGTVTIDNLTTSGGTGGSSTIATAPETAGDKLLNNIMSMGGTEVTIKVELCDTSKSNTINASLNQENQTNVADIEITFVGNLNISSLDNIKLNGNLKVVIGAQEINVFIAYLNDVIYVSNDTLNIKLETTSLSKIFELLPAMGLNLNLDLNMEEINVDDLMSMFQNIKETKINENLIKMQLNLFEMFDIDIYCDSEYNVQSIEAKNIAISNYTLNLSAGLNKEDYVEIVNPEEDTEKEFVDVTKTLNIVDSIKEILNNKKLHLNLNAGFVDNNPNIEILGKVDIDFSNDVNLFADLNLIVEENVHSLKLGYINSNVYMDFNNVKFMVEKSTILETIEVINKEFNLSQVEQNLILEIAKIIPGFELSKVLEGNFSDINIDNLLEFSTGVDNTINITMFGKSLGISNDLKLIIALDENDQFSNLSLSGIKILDTELFANVEYSSVVTIPEINNEEYLNFNNLPKLINAVINTSTNLMQNKLLELNINAQLNVNNIDAVLCGLVSVDFNDKENLVVYANVDITLLNKITNVELLLKDDVIYLSVDHLKFQASVAEIDDLINTISSNLNDNSLSQIIGELVNNTNSDSVILKLLSGDISALTNDLIKELNISQNSAYIVLNKSLISADQDIKFVLTYDNQINGIVIPSVLLKDINVSLNVNLTQIIVVPQINANDYESLKYSKNLIASALNTIDYVLTNKKLALDVNVNVLYKDSLINVVGIMAIDANGLYATLDVPFNNRTLNVELYLINNEIYLNIDGLKVFTNIDSLQNLINQFEGETKDVLVVLNQVFPLFNFEEISNLNLQSLSLNLIKSIKIGKNQTDIVLSNEYINSVTDIVLSVGYNNQITCFVLNGLNMFNVGLNLSAELNYNFDVPTLNKLDYGDLTNIDVVVKSILNTVKNVSQNKQIALNLNVNATSNNKKYSVSGLVYVDLENLINNKTFELESLTACAELKIKVEDNRFDIKVNLNNGYLFVEYQEFKAKIKVESINQVVETILDLLPEENKIDVSDILNDYFADSVLLDVINKDYSKLSLSLIKSISTSKNGLYLTLDKSLLNSNRDILISISFADEKIGLINVLNASVKDIKLTTANLEFIYNYNYASVNESEYFEISGISELINSLISTINHISNTKQIALDINNTVIYLSNKNIHLNGTIYIDFANAITQDENGQRTFNIAELIAYAKINVKTFNLQNKSFDEYEHNIEATLVGGNIYVTYNNLSVSISIDSLTDAVNLIMEMVNLNKEESEQTFGLDNVDFVSILNDIFPNLDLSGILSGDISSLDLNLIKYLNITNTNLELILNKDVLGVTADIALNLSYLDKLTGLTMSGLNLSNINLDLVANINYNFELPSVDASKYSNLNNITDFANSMLNTAKEINDNKNIAFNLNTVIKIVNNSLDDNDIITNSNTTIITILNNSYAMFDWNNAYDIVDNAQVFNIEKLSIYANVDLKVDTTSVTYNNGIADESTTKTNTTYHHIEVKYINNVVYITYNNMKVKLSGEGIGLTIDSICEMLGFEVTTNSFDNLLGLIENLGSDTSMLDKISIEMIKSLTLTDSKFSAVFDITSLELGLGEEFNILNLDVIYNAQELEYLTIKDLNIKNVNIDAINIGLMDYVTILDYSSEEKSAFMDLSTIGELIEAVKNTIKFTDFSLSGNVQLKLDVIGIKLTFDVPVTADIKFVNGKLEAKAVLGPVPVIAGVNDDAPYQFGNTVSGINPGEDRILTIYIKDDMVYMHRRELVPVFLSADKVYEKKLKVHIDTLVDDPLYYLLQFGLGLSDSIMDAIMSSLNTERTKPLDYSNILKGYTSSDNLYTLTLNLAELTDNEQLDTMSVGIKTTTYNNNNVVGGLTFNMFMPVASGVEITLNSDDLTFNNIGGTCDLSSVDEFISTYTYKEGAEWDAYNGDWSLSSQRTFTITFVTNCSQEVNSVEGVAGTGYILPLLENYTVDDGTTCTTYEFAGWYTTKTFDAGTEYTDNIIPRTNKTLYAKWNAITSKYVYISFVTNGGESIETIKVLEGTKLNLPTYLDLIIVEEDGVIYTKQFDGWYMEDTFENVAPEFAPTSDMVLYAKWSVVDTKETYVLNVYDNNILIMTKRLLENAEIKLTGLSKFNGTTKYYLDSEYTTEFTNMVMPASDFSLHIRNEYSLKLVSNYGTILNSTIIYYQGSVVSIPNQTSYYYDDGTQTNRTIYTFNGYLVNGTKVDNLSSYTMPNENVEIVADWSISIKEYYTVTFNKDTTVASAYKDSIYFPITSVKILDGEKLILDDSYTPTWIYSTGKVLVTWWHYKFQGWTLELGKSTFTEIVISGDTTIYANWNGIVKTGKN